MSASLDDMPAYEHFQDELDLELLRYAKLNNITNTAIENEFIQFICFSLFLSKPIEITPEILNHFLNDHESYRVHIVNYLQFMNDDKNSFLEKSFTGLLSSIC